MCKHILCCCLYVLSFSYVSIAQEAPAEQLANEEKPSLFSWLYTGTDEVLELTIETDVRCVIRQKLKEEYQKATLKIRNADGELFEQQLKIRARGNTRKEVCYYPPLKLKFKKSVLSAAGFSSSNELKLVTQCRDTKTCEFYTAKEYMAYKLYNMISPYSFRVQLLRISFVDTKGKGKTKEMLGFLIEPEEEMAERVGGKLAERNTMRSTFLTNEPNQRMAIFQYMIGNTDWSIGNSHNLKFLKVPEYERLTPVPYDFDYAGLVNTDYAIPFTTLPIKSVTERLYRGIECLDAEIPPLVEYFKAREDEIMNYTASFPHFSDPVRREVSRYLEDFFDFLDREKHVRSAFGSK